MFCNVSVVIYADLITKQSLEVSSHRSNGVNYEVISTIVSGVYTFQKKDI